MNYGIFYEYWQKDWGADFRIYTNKVADLGFNCLEVGAADLLDLSREQLLELKAVGKDRGIQFSANIGPAKQYDVGSKDPAVRAAGVKYLSSIMDKMDILGCKIIIGVQYSYWPYDFEDLDKEALWDRSVGSVKLLGKHAEDLGITVALEVVNRFETILLNTAEEGVRYCKDVDCRNVKLLLDTFHMNIEEEDIPTAIRTAGDYMAHLHVGESNRKLPGQCISNLDWFAIGKALKDINYKGFVIMEPFVTPNGQIAKDIKLWRDLGGTAPEAVKDAEAKKALAYLKERFE